MYKLAVVTKYNHFYKDLHASQTDQDPLEGLSKLPRGLQDDLK